MSEIKSNGVPTRNTKGAVGDIYIDATTGTKYKCTGAYINSDKADYEWKKVVDINKKHGVQQSKEVKPHDSSLAKPKKAAKKAEESKPEKTEEKVEAPAEEVKEKAAESKPAKNGKGNKQHNYGQHYNSNK